MLLIISGLFLLGALIIGFLYINNKRKSGPNPQQIYATLAKEQWQNGPQLDYNLSRNNPESEVDSNQVVIIKGF